MQADGTQTGVAASGKITGVSATASEGSGVSASGSGEFGIGVVGNGTFSGGQFSSATGIGVSAGSNGKGPGVFASSHDGLGGEFIGARAPLRLRPAATAGRPEPVRGVVHEVGELYVDSQGQLFLCTGAGSPGTWVKVTVTPAP